jgi:hypothetical protein
MLPAKCCVPCWVCRFIISRIEPNDGTDPDGLVALARSGLLLIRFESVPAMLLLLSGTSM